MAKNILVLEDEASLSTVIKNKLELEDFKVYISDNVKDGLNILKKEKIDVVWLDHYLLGGENGIDFVSEVKKNPEWKNLPIFVVSNTASLDKVTTYLKLGVIKYLTKADFRLENIIQDINSYLNKQEKS